MFRALDLATFAAFGLATWIFPANAQTSRPFSGYYQGQIMENTVSSTSDTLCNMVALSEQNGQVQVLSDHWYRGGRTGQLFHGTGYPTSGIVADTAGRFTIAVGTKGSQLQNMHYCENDPSALCGMLYHGGNGGTYQIVLKPTQTLAQTCPLQ